MQTICTSLQTDNHTNTSSLNVYRPDALPDARPTRRQTDTVGLAVQGQKVEGQGQKATRTHLAEDGQAVVGQQSVGLVHEEVATNELLEAPVLALHEPIRALTLCNTHTQHSAQLSPASLQGR